MLCLAWPCFSFFILYPAVCFFLLPVFLRSGSRTVIVFAGFVEFFLPHIFFALQNDGGNKKVGVGVSFFLVLHTVLFYFRDLFFGWACMTAFYLLPLVVTFIFTASLFIFYSLFVTPATLAKGPGPSTLHCRLGWIGRDAFAAFLSTCASYWSVRCCPHFFTLHFPLPVYFYFTFLFPMGFMAYSLCRCSILVVLIAFSSSHRYSSQSV